MVQGSKGASEPKKKKHLQSILDEKGGKTSAKRGRLTKPKGWEHIRQKKTYGRLEMLPARKREGRYWGEFEIRKIGGGRIVTGYFIALSGGTIVTRKRGPGRLKRKRLTKGERVVMAEETSSGSPGEKNTISNKGN